MWCVSRNAFIINESNCIYFSRLYQKYFALLVQQVQDSHLGFYEVDAGLIVVEVNQSPGDLLLHVHLLLQLEHVLKVGEAAEWSSELIKTRALCNDFCLMVAYQVKLLLKLLVGVVDAELFKTVDLKRLKPAESHRQFRSNTNLDLRPTTSREHLIFY